MEDLETMEIETTQALRPESTGLRSQPICLWRHCPPAVYRDPALAPEAARRLEQFLFLYQAQPVRPRSACLLCWAQGRHGYPGRCRHGDVHLCAAWDHPQAFKGANGRRLLALQPYRHAIPHEDLAAMVSGVDVAWFDEGSAASWYWPGGTLLIVIATPFRPPSEQAGRRERRRSAWHLRHQLKS
jgi:hypothetical protein